MRNISEIEEELLQVEREKKETEWKLDSIKNKRKRLEMELAECTVMNRLYYPMEELSWHIGEVVKRVKLIVRFGHSFLFLVQSDEDSFIRISEDGHLCFFCPNERKVLYYNKEEKSYFVCSRLEKQTIDIIGFTDIEFENGVCL